MFWKVRVIFSRFFPVTSLFWVTWIRSHGTQASLFFINCLGMASGSINLTIQSYTLLRSISSRPSHCWYTYFNLCGVIKKNCDGMHRLYSFSSDPNDHPVSHLYLWKLVAAKRRWEQSLTLILLFIIEERVWLRIIIIIALIDNVV